MPTQLEPTKHQCELREADNPWLGHIYWVWCNGCHVGFGRPQYDASDARGIARRHTNWWQEHGDE